MTLSVNFLELYNFYCSPESVTFKTSDYFGCKDDMFDASTDRKLGDAKVLVCRHLTLSVLGTLYRNFT